MWQRLDLDPHKNNEDPKTCCSVFNLILNDCK
jgi:hypothetical protein